MLKVIYLQLTCDWTFELLAMGCYKSFNMLNIVTRNQCKNKCLKLHLVDIIYLASFIQENYR